MARQVIVELVDDLDGGPAQETVRFGVAGTDYEIDLSTEHAEAMRRAFAPFIAAARGSRPGATRHAKPAGRRGVEASGDAALTEMREWARANGFPVAERGRLSREVRQAFDATPPEVRAEQAATFAGLPDSSTASATTATAPRSAAPMVTFSRAGV